MNDEQKINNAYDLIIIGGGPAGAAAGVYAARKKIRTLIVTYEFGGQSSVSDNIQNWIGTISISGMELAKNLKEHVRYYGGDDLVITEREKVSTIEKNGNIFDVKTESGKIFKTKTILLGTGSVRRKLEALNADKLEHKGITYCASCDGPLFGGMDVVVIGGGNAAFESAAQLTAYANSVTIINRGDAFRADEITVEKVLAHPKIKVLKNTIITEVNGESFVEGLKYKNIETNEEGTLAVQGIFVEIGQIPNTQFLKDLVKLNKSGQIEIDPWNQKTSVDGIWAAGDATNILYHQNNIAAGDAVKAIEDIHMWLNTRG